VSRWNSFNRREFLSTALGAAASFSALPPGHRLIGEPLEPQSRFAPFQFLAVLDGTRDPLAAWWGWR